MTAESAIALCEELAEKERIKSIDYAERLFRLEQLEYKREFSIFVRDGMLKHLHELYDKMANYEYHATKKSIVWARDRYNNAEHDRLTAHLAISKLLEDE